MALQFFHDNDIDWTQKTDVGSFKATYSTTQGLAASCRATFTGSKVQLLVGRSPRGGTNVSGDTSAATIRTEIRKGGTLYEAHEYNLWLSTSWFSYDGVYAPTAATALSVNPCILDIGNNLTYDSYTVAVIVVNGGQDLAFEGFLFYDDDLDGEVESFRTGDTNGPGQVTGLDIINSGQDIRNEAYVLGRFKSFKFAPNPVQSNADEGLEKQGVVNPNNPISEYVISVARDLDSIYKSTASNYVGMPRRTLIQDPSIGSQGQADYLSVNFINRFATTKKDLSFQTLGNPLLEINDKVLVTDEFSEAIDSSQPVWLKSVSSDFDNTYISSYDSTGFKPISSFFPKPIPNIDADFGGDPVINFRIENRGVITRVNTTFNAAETTEITLATVDGLPERGYIYLQTYDATVPFETVHLEFYWIHEHFNIPTGPAPGKLFEIIKYDRRDPDGTQPGKIYGLTRGLQYSSTAPWNADQQVIGAYDPYQQEGTGIMPTIKFDSLISGKLYIQVFGRVKDFPYHVDTLTGLGKEGFPFDVYDDVEWGRNKEYRWQCRDMVGKWNVLDQHKHQMKGAASGYYVAEEDDDADHIPQYSLFTFDMTFLGDDGRTYTYSSPKDYADNRYVSTARIVTRRGPVGKVNFRIQYDGCWGPKFQKVGVNPANNRRGEDSFLEPENNEDQAYAMTNIIDQFTMFSTATDYGDRFFYLHHTAAVSTGHIHHIAIDTSLASGASGPKMFDDGTESNAQWPYHNSDDPSFEKPYQFWSNPGFSDAGEWIQRGAKAHGAPLFFTSTSNNNDGLKIILRSGVNPYNERDDQFGFGEDGRIQEILDSDYKRHYSINLKFHIHRRSLVMERFWEAMFGTEALSGITSDWGDKIAPYVANYVSRYNEILDGDLFVDDSINYDLYNGGNGFLLHFNPANVHEYNYGPGPDAEARYNSRGPMVLSDDAESPATIAGDGGKQLYCMTLVNFSGGFSDNSGRSPHIWGDLFGDPRYFRQFTNSDGSTFGTRSMESFVETPGTETLWRYDGNRRPRYVAYHDPRVEMKFENSAVNPVNNMVRLYRARTQFGGWLPLQSEDIYWYFKQE